jgi:YegS/Rv2252/BmrU family lipid kinase
MPRTTIVLNPTAGRGAGERLRPQIVDWLQGHGLDFELAVTSAPGHARVIARDAVAQGREAVIAVGGDGTSHEVLNGLMEAGSGPEGPALGVLPVGTGNDFALGAGVPGDLRKACQVLCRGQTRVLDVGWVQADNEEARFFGNGVGIGFDAIVNIESRKLKRLRGFFLYLVAVLRTLAFYYHAPLIEVRIDGEEIVQPSMMITIMNGHRLGGGFRITPGSQMDDGLLDLCVTGKVGRLKMVGYVPRFIRGTHITDKHVTMCQGQKVTVVCESPWAGHVDGEIYGVGGSRFEIVLLPQRLRLIC